MKEGQLPQDAAPAQISLTDCLACSGCVTSAEAVLVSLQSHAEVLNSLDDQRDRIFVASISPQVRASIAATYGATEKEAGWMIEQLLAGPEGLASRRKGSGFRWVVDTNAAREAIWVLSDDEVTESLNKDDSKRDEGHGAPITELPNRPILSSACPGWICYAEKTHPHVLPHLSHLKSPQALTGTLLKTVLCQRLGVSPNKIWHLAVMPCFDKKLEASREELTDAYWNPDSLDTSSTPIRDVDCVITARELLMLADTSGISFPSLPRRPLPDRPSFPDKILSPFLYPRHSKQQIKEAGTSGGFLHHILQTQLSRNPGSTLTTTRGRNADVIDFTIFPASLPLGSDHLCAPAIPIFKAARYYGFRNIQNLVRKLKPARQSHMPLYKHTSNKSTKAPVMSLKSKVAGNSAGSGVSTDYAYVEVMACPGGCTNGGGQIKIDDLPSQSAAATTTLSSAANRAEGVEVNERRVLTQKEWLQKVDEAYFSMSSSSEDEEDDHNTHDIHDDTPQKDSHPKNSNNNEYINGIHVPTIRNFLNHWSSTTGIPLEKLIYTTYRKVESDVGKGNGASAATGTGGGDTERVAEVASRIGGGW